MKVLKLLLPLVLIVFVASICLADEVKGKITAVDAAGGTLEISGIRIAAQAALIEGSMDERIELAALKVGDYVEVDGFFTEPGRLSARKVEKEPVGPDKVKGTINRVDAVGRQLLIGGVTVKVPVTALIEGEEDVRIPIQQLRANSIVECEGTFTGPMELTAVKVETD